MYLQTTTSFLDSPARILVWNAIFFLQAMLHDYKYMIDIHHSGILTVLIKWHYCSTAKKTKLLVL